MPRRVVGVAETARRKRHDRRHDAQRSRQDRRGRKRGRRARAVPSRALPEPLAEMTSPRARPARVPPLGEIFAAVHPVGIGDGRAGRSRTMEILRDSLECCAARRLHRSDWLTSRPDGDARFSVADSHGCRGVRCAGRLEFGVGSGIVWDSDRAADIYEECSAEGVAARPSRPAVLPSCSPPLRWDTRRGVHADRSPSRAAAGIGRALKTALGFVFELSDVCSLRWRRLVEALASSDRAQRVRDARVDEVGHVTIEHQLFNAWGERPMRVTRSPASRSIRAIMSSCSTTRPRTVSATMRSRIGMACDDVVLWNQDRQVKLRKFDDGNYGERRRRIWR